MTQSERTYLEEKLFLQTNLDTKLRSTIKNVYEQYKSTCDIFPDMHEAKFGMLYCRMILENDTNEMPHYKSIIFYTKESQTSYYMCYKRQYNIVSTNHILTQVIRVLKIPLQSNYSATAFSFFNTLLI